MSKEESSTHGSGREQKFYRRAAAESGWKQQAYRRAAADGLPELLLNIRNNEQYGSNLAVSPIPSDNKIYFFHTIRPVPQAKLEELIDGYMVSVKSGEEYAPDLSGPEYVV